MKGNLLQQISLLVLTCTLSPICWGQKYKVTDLGVPADAPFTNAYAVNNSGQVTGIAGQKGFFWDPKSGMQTFQLGVGNNDITAINDWGQVSGNTFLGASKESFIWDNQSGFHELLQSDVRSTIAYGLNNKGQVIGEAAFGLGDSGAARYDPGSGWKSLGNLSLSTAYGMNDHGDAVGQWAEPGFKPPVPFMYTDALGMVSLGLPSDMNQGAAWDINDQGYIAGYWARKIDLSWRAWLRKPNGEYITIEPPVLPGQTKPYGINNSNQVVGYFTNVNGTFGFLWSEQDGLENIASICGGGLDGYTKVEATGISDTGYISATGRINNVPHALLLTPVPEPPLWLGFVGVLGLLGLRRRRSRIQTCF